MITAMSDSALPNLPIKIRTYRPEDCTACRSLYVGGLVGGKIAANDTGLDIDGIHTVVNYELPDSPETYVHRVGRTGRADEPGHAITLVAPSERHALALLEKAVGVNIELKSDV